MKPLYLFVFFICCSFQIHAQVAFEKGYFINNSNQTVSCFIKNTEWKNNPAQFSYKLDENGPEQQMGIEDVKEYGLAGKVRFVRKTVQIDRTSDKFGDLDDKREPDFQEEQVFLRQLLDARAASLYIYQDSQVKRFFYSKENSDPKPLIFKKYLDANNKVATNAYYKQQLFNQFDCGNLNAEALKNTDYNQEDLLKFFKEINACKGESYEIIDGHKEPVKINIAVKAGANHSTFSLEQQPWERTIEMESKVTYTVGLEGEYILPSFNQKLGFFGGIFYTSYNSTGEGVFYNGSRNILPTTFMGTRGVFNISYSSVEIPLGVRYYLHLGSNSKMILHAAYSPSVTFDDSDIHSMEGEQLKPDFKLDSFQPGNFLIGAGYEYKNRLSLEARFFPRKNMVYNDEWSGDHNGYISVLLGYKFYKNK